MTTPVTAHPSFVDLREFDRGRLDGPAADTIAQHLAECPTCQECIDQMPPDTFVGRLQSARPASGGTPFPPKTLDLPAAAKTLDLPHELANHPAYRIVGELGRGGMGIVYKAEHKLMRRIVAVKVVPPEKLGDDETRDRFLNEIRAAAQLEHDNIVRAYAAEMIGRSFVLEMELVDGHSLDHALTQKGPLLVAEACHFARQAALGLQHMHERGLVHRDIKPQNLMVTPKGTVKILDVGLARSTSGLDKRLTQSGVVMGTPDYIAPEQIRNPRAADIRADIYSLGCTLYHFLSGRPPFTAEGLTGVVLAHLEGNAEPLTALRAELPAELSAVVARMMARDPADRYPTPGEAAKALLPYCESGNGEAPARERTVADGVVIGADARRGAVALAGSLPSCERPAARSRVGFLVGAAFAGILLASTLVAGIVLTIKTKDGIISLRVDPPDADVDVEDGKITVTRSGEKESYTIVVAEGGGKLRISKAGFAIQVREVTLEEKGTTIAVSLQPLTPTPTEPQAAKPVPAPTAPFRWPADKLIAGEIAAPDLGVCRLVSANDFAVVRPESKKLILKTANKGCVFHPAVSFKSQDIREFACEVVAQKTAEGGSGWGIGFLKMTAEARDEIAIALWPGRRLEVVRQFRAPTWRTEKLYSVEPHPAVRGKGEWNRLLCIVRGRRLEIYVNERAVANPVDIDDDVKPVVRYWTWTGENARGGHVEVQRFRFWDVQSLPSLEDRARALGYNALKD